jgi:predicted helicase
MDGVELGIFMDVHNLERLRSIRTFPSLVKYLREELDWPVESENFEDLTFEYEPEELGLEPKIAVKIKEIKQLRPFITDQPWGIFFINFEPKRLPVVVLRRVLRALVIKKRQSLSKADQKFWKLHDLLFVSSYGESEDRSITFAHFSDSDNSGLPTLKVIGWDYQDTPLHLDQCAKELEKLKFSEDLSSDDWRKQWVSAFSLEHREVITTSKALAERMAVLATKIRRRVNAVLKLESENGPIRKLYKAFQKTLIHDLSEDDFADMYAQTITYGLFSARCSREADFIAENLSDMIPVTNPFLKELLSTFLTIGGKKGKIDFDELGINDVVQILRDANMEAIKRDFDDKNPEHDPVIHFYEDFLKQYDAEKKVKRGVFYTPKPVVSFIVRSVDEILRKEFGLEDGLADTTTWGEMAKRNKDIKIPDGVSENEPFVQILDPAIGTGTFLVEVIDIVYKTIKKKWEKAGHMEFEFRNLWNEYVPKHLLPRLYGFELMMAPYAIAHMKIGLKLFETGYRFGEDERARIYLTNSLEPPQDFADTFEQMAPALAHEAQAVNAVKRHQHFTVVIGNPPYAQMSQNLGEYQRELVAPYRFVNGVRIRERGALTFERNLQDDYVKFLRLGEMVISASNQGICGFITNHAYLSNITLRGLRAHLLETFKSVRILDLHGNTKIHEVPPAGITDQNVFDIQQGVAVAFMIRPTRDNLSKVTYDELWGTRANKYQSLQARNTPNGLEVNPCEPNFLFVPLDNKLTAEYKTYTGLNDVFNIFGSAITTARDGIVVDFEDSPIVQRVLIFQNRSFSDCEVLSKLQIGESSIWKVSDARKRLKGVSPEQHLFDAAYRPFDIRRLFYNNALVSSPRHPTMDHMLAGKNLALAVCRQQCVPGFQHVFVSKHIFDEGLVSNRSREKTVAFPLFLTVCGDDSLLESSMSPNFRPEFIAKFQKQLQLQWRVEGGDLIKKRAFGPYDLFHYLYAILFSPEYRLRYQELLKRDFPRLPLTSNPELFCSLAQLGGELVSLHLMESDKLNKHLTKWTGTTPSGEIEKVTWSDNTVWINKSKTEGFKGVTENVWNFHIGGYQVCEKWLKDRKGRKLSKEDIEHYHKIIVALNETIRIMKEIDEVIAAHGAWPIKQN